MGDEARIAVGVGSTLLAIIGLVNVCLGIYLRTKLTDSNLPWSWPVHIVAGCVVTVVGTLIAIFVCTKEIGKEVLAVFGVANLPSFGMSVVQAVASKARDAYLEAKKDPDLNLYERLEEACLALSAITIIIICVVIGAFAIGFCRESNDCCDCKSCFG